MLSQQSALSRTVSPMFAIGRRPVRDHFNILVWDMSAISRGSFSHMKTRLRCRSSLRVRISKNPWYQTVLAFWSVSVRLFQQRASFPLNRRSTVPVRKYKNPRYPPSSAGQFLLLQFIHKKHRIYSSVVHFYQFRYLGVQCS